ncbi:Ectoine hydroxylase [Balamuthia mandrillaris]
MMEPQRATPSTGFKLSAHDFRSWKENGYVLVRSLLDAEELSLIRTALEGDSAILQNAYTVSSGQGNDVRLCLWNQPGDDITGMIARAHKVAGTMEQLLGGEVYHYHTKLMMKEALTGGQFVWHQDYGYWYNNGCLFPDMATVFIAIDPCHPDNGCLEVLKGSHKMGRIDHTQKGQQTGADTERLSHAMQRFPRVAVEMQPGDALFFHCNLLHASGPNHSEERRWAFLIAYNRASNDPVKEHHHPRYTPLRQVSDEAIRKCTSMTNCEGKDFLSREREEKHGHH